MSEYKKLSTIEHLPNELFLEIFRFIDVYDLHRGWAKLNKRFRSILHSIPMHAYLKKKHDYIGYKPYFRYYASQFMYIRIEEVCDIPETFDVSHFSNIRSLHLGIATPKQYDHITPDNMPYLTHLTVTQLQVHGNPVFLLCGPKQFAHLKTSQLPYFFPTKMQLQACLTIRSLHLNFCSAEIFFEQIKVLLPNLVYFESVFGSDFTDMNFMPKPNLMVPHTTLRHLKIGLRRYAPLNFLALLLTVTPEVYHLELHCWYRCDYRVLADLLQATALKLKQFSFTCDETNLTHTDINVVKVMSPWFSEMKIEKYGDIKRIICNMKKVK
jgi:hypothetical protein